MLRGSARFVDWSPQRNPKGLHRAQREREKRAGCDSVRNHFYFNLEIILNKLFLTPLSTTTQNLLRPQVMDNQQLCMMHQAQEVLITLT